MCACLVLDFTVARYLNLLARLNSYRVTKFFVTFLAFLTLGDVLQGLEIEELDDTASTGCRGRTVPALFSYTSVTRSSGKPRPAADPWIWSPGLGHLSVNHVNIVLMILYIYRFP